MNKVEKASLAPNVITPDPVDGFQKFKRCLEAEKILHSLHRTDFEIFVLNKLHIPVDVNGLVKQFDFSALKPVKVLLNKIDMPRGDHCAAFGCDNDRRYPERWIKKDNVGFLRFHQRREKKFKLFSSLIKRKVIDSKGNWTEFEVTKNTRICSNHFQDGRPIDENPHPSLLMKRYDENSSLSSPADRTNTPTSSGKKLKPPTLKGSPGTRGSRRQRLKEAEKRSFKSKIWKPKSALL